MEACGFAFERCVRISVEALQMQGTWAVIQTRKYHDHMALSFGRPTVLGDLLKVKCRLANNNVPFQEKDRAPPQTTLYTLRSRLLYWWKRMQVSRLALHVLVVTGEQISAT